MKKIIAIFYSLVGITLLLSFFATVFTGFFFRKIRLGEHLFNVPLFFFTLLFLCFWFLVTFPAPWSKTKNKIKSQVGKYLASIFIFGMAMLTGYFCIYLPLHSKLIVEIPQTYLETNKPIILTAKANTSYYIETDAYYKTQGTKLKIIVSNEDWSEEVSFTLARKNNSQRGGTVFGTTLTDLPFRFPQDGVYNFYVSAGDDLVNVKVIRLFEKE